MTRFRWDKGQEIALLFPGFSGEENVSGKCIFWIHLKQKPEPKMCQIREGNLTLTTLSEIFGYIT